MGSEIRQASRLLYKTTTRTNKMKELLSLLGQKFGEKKLVSQYAQVNPEKYYQEYCATLKNVLVKSALYTTSFFFIVGMILDYFQTVSKVDLFIILGSILFPVSATVFYFLKKIEEDGVVEHAIAKRWRKIRSELQKNIYFKQLAEEVDLLGAKNALHHNRALWEELQKVMSDVAEMV